MVDARPHEEWTPQQQRALLEQALQCLGQVAATDQLLQDAPGASAEARELAHRTRLELGQDIQAVRNAWRAAHEAPPRAPALAEGAVHAGFPPFTQTLGPGGVTAGLQVLNLQKLLALEGIIVAQNGRYDGATAQGVRRLQVKYGLARPDGIVGGEMRKLLNRLTGQAEGRRG